MFLINFLMFNGSLKKVILPQLQVLLVFFKESKSIITLFYLSM